MSRRIQVFTRLTGEQTSTLVEIGHELDSQGIPGVVRRGVVNVSEVIRILLGRADRRLR